MISSAGLIWSWKNRKCDSSQRQKERNIGSGLKLTERQLISCIRTVKKCDRLTREVQPPSVEVFNTSSLLWLSEPTWLRAKVQSLIGLRFLPNSTVPQFSEKTAFQLCQIFVQLWKSSTKMFWDPFIYLWDCTFTQQPVCRINQFGQKILDNACTSSLMLPSQSPGYHTVYTTPATSWISFWDKQSPLSSIYVIFHT